MMSKKMIAWLLKLVVLFAAAVFVFAGAYVVPRFIAWNLSYAPEVAPVVTPAIVSINLSFITVYISLFLAWQIFSSIPRDESFSTKNAKRFKTIMLMALLGTLLLVLFMWWALTFHATLVFPFMIIFAGVLFFIGLLSALICYALSQLVAQAAALKDEADYTV